MYADNRPNGPGGNTVVSAFYAGGSFYGSPNGNSDYSLKTNLEAPFSLQGNPVPEPTSALLLLGSGAMLLLRRRRAAV